ncbi:MAG: hypothetical protein ABSD12_18395 [Paraburkholderia sp.]|jgi:hypothetical protein
MALPEIKKVLDAFDKRPWVATSDSRESNVRRQVFNDGALSTIYVDASNVAYWPNPARRSPQSNADCSRYAKGINRPSAAIRNMQPNVGR